MQGDASARMCCKYHTVDKTARMLNRKDVFSLCHATAMLKKLQGYLIEVRMCCHCLKKVQLQVCVATIMYSYNICSKCVATVLNMLTC